MVLWFGSCDLGCVGFVGFVGVEVVDRGLKSTGGSTPFANDLDSLTEDVLQLGLSFDGDRDLARSVSCQNIISRVPNFRCTVSGAAELLTCSTSLSLFATLQNVLFKLSRPLFIFSISFVLKTCNPCQELVDRLRVVH